MSNEFLALILFSIYLLHFPLSFSVCVVLELYHSFNRTIHLPPSLFYTHSASPFFLPPSLLQLLRESIAEHKPHIDKLLKIGPQLAALSHQEGATVRKRYSDAEKRYVAIKEVVKGRATTLDEAVSQSAQVWFRKVNLKSVRSSKGCRVSKLVSADCCLNTTELRRPYEEIE